MVEITEVARMAVNGRMTAMGRMRTALRTVSLLIKRWMAEVMMLVVGMVLQRVGCRMHWWK